MPRHRDCGCHVSRARHARRQHEANEFRSAFEAEKKRREEAAAKQRDVASKEVTRLSARLQAAIDAGKLEELRQVLEDCEGKSVKKELLEEARKLRDLHHPGLLPFLALATDGLHHWGEVHICQTTSLAFMLTKASQAGKDAEAPASAFFQNAGERAFSFTGFRSAEDETLISTQFLAPSTPDDDERFAQRGPSPRAARAPRPTAFSPM